MSFVRSDILSPRQLDTPVNDPNLFVMVTVRATRAFRYRGRRYEPGATVRVERWLSDDLVFLRRAERVT